MAACSYFHVSKIFSLYSGFNSCHQPVISFVCVQINAINFWRINMINWAQSQNVKCAPESIKFPWWKALTSEVKGGHPLPSQPLANLTWFGL